MVRAFFVDMLQGAMVIGLTVVGSLALCISAPSASAEEVQAGTVGPAPAATSDDGGRMEPLPEDLQGVGVTEKTGDALPLDLRFTNQDGRPVELSDFFDGTHPVLLTLNYSSCPMLCSLQLNGLIDGLQEMEWTAGNEFRVVTVSIDPTETTQLAKRTKQKYLKTYGRAGVGDGWEFLTGNSASITALAESVGFGYRLVKETGEYAHTAVTFVIMPNGVISRYLYGVQYEPKTLRLSLVEAAEGKIGTTVDRILLFCFHYDATKGKYGPAAMNIMRLGGTLTVLALGILVTHYRRREKRREEAL